MKGILVGCCLALMVVFAIGVSYVVAQVFFIVAGQPTATSSGLEETAVRPATSRAKIALINVHGLILRDGLASQGVASQELIETELRAAEADSDVKAIILDIDSPGGGVVPSAAIHDAVAAAGKPVVALFSGDAAASGAVYASAGARRIISRPDTLTGSIGVIAEFLDLSELLNKYGVKMNTIKSGPFKDIGSATRQMTPEERAMLQGLIDESYNRFVQAVADGRHLDLATVKGLADGRIFSGTTAKSLGLVDEVGDLDTAIGAAKDLAKISDAAVIQYSQPFSIASVISQFTSHLQNSDPLGLLLHTEEKPSLRLLYVME